MAERSAGLLPDASGRTFCIIFALALVLRLVFLLAIGPISSPDTFEYKLLGHNVLTTGEYARFDQVTGQWLPYAFRMPLYQYFLAGIFAVFGETGTADWAIVIVQAVLSAATAGLVSLLGAMTVGRTVGILAGFFFALDPLPVMHTAYIMTDTLFVFLVTSALLVSVWALRSRTPIAFLIWGLLIGAATLTRPLLKYYAIVPITTLILSRWSIRSVARQSLACLLGIAVLLGPWMIRNKIRLDFWGLELNHGLNMVWSTFRLTQISSPAERQADPKLAATRDIVAQSSGPATILTDVKRQLGVPEVVADRYLERVGWENARRYPLDVAALAARNGMRILVSRVGAHELFQRLGLLNEVWQTTKLKEAIIVSLLVVSFVIVCIGMPWACWPLWRRQENRPWLICFALTCVYIIGLTSLVAGYDRYRLPIEGILWILFAAFVVELRKRLSLRTQEEKVGGSG